MKPHERLALAKYLIESDSGFEADCVHLDKHNGRNVSGRELILADLVSKLYTLLHSYKSTCKNRHSDWEEENQKDYNFAPPTKTIKR